MMKQPNWGMGTSCYKSNMAANSSGLKKKKLALLMMMMLQDEEASSKIVSRKVWACKWLLRRPEKGVFYTLFKELPLEDSGGFLQFMRMPYELSSLFLFSIICTETSSTTLAAILKVSSQ